MGYWNAGSTGASLLSEQTGLMWGDAPADVMDDALYEIAVVFRRDVGRNPTKGELLAGLRFSLGSPTDEQLKEPYGN